MRLERPAAVNAAGLGGETGAKPKPLEPCDALLRPVLFRDVGVPLIERQRSEPA